MESKEQLNLFPGLNKKEESTKQPEEVNSQPERFINKIERDKDGYKYLTLEMKLDGLKTVYSVRHRALLVLDQDSKNYNGNFYEYPYIIEIIKK